MGLGLDFLGGYLFEKYFLPIINASSFSQELNCFHTVHATGARPQKKISFEQPSQFEQIPTARQGNNMVISKLCI